VVGDLSPAASWARKLHWVKGVVGHLEVVTNGVDLVHEVLDAVHAQVSETLLDNGVIGNLHSLAVDLDGTSLVDHVLDGGLAWVAPGDEWIADSEHLDGGLVESDKNGVSDLSESEELEGLLRLWRELVDTSDSDDQSEFGLIWHEVVTVVSGGLGVVNKSLGLGGVLGGVLSGLGDDLSSLGKRVLLGNSLGLGLGGSLLGESRSLLGEALWHSGLGDFGNGHFLVCFWSVSCFLKN